MLGASERSLCLDESASTLPEAFRAERRTPVTRFSGLDIKRHRLSCPSRQMPGFGLNLARGMLCTRGRFSDRRARMPYAHYVNWRPGAERCASSLAGPRSAPRFQTGPRSASRFKPARDPPRGSNRAAIRPAVQTAPRSASWFKPPRDPPRGSNRPAIRLVVQTVLRSASRFNPPRGSIRFVFESASRLGHHQKRKTLDPTRRPRTKPHHQQHPPPQHPNQPHHQQHPQPHQPPTQPRPTTTTNPPNQPTPTAPTRKQPPHERPHLDPFFAVNKKTRPHVFCPPRFFEGGQKTLF